MVTLPMILAAKQSGIKKVIIPEVNTEEAKLVQGKSEISKLTDVIRLFLEGKEKFEDGDEKSMKTHKDIILILGVKGQRKLLRHGFSGGHNMLIIGNRGCKDYDSRRIPTFFQNDGRECLEVTKIYSISGLLPAGHSLIRNRPFRAPTS